MTATPTLLKTSAAVAVVALAVGLRPHYDASPHHQPSARVVPPEQGLDATTDAEARAMRKATRGLGRDLGTAARCDATTAPRRFAACVLPALRRATARAPAGACRNYLVGLQAAHYAADDEASFLISELYGAHRRARQRHVAQRVAAMSRMFDRASRAGTKDVCAAGSGGPAA